MRAIVLYDGECSFCNGTVQWIIKHDSKGYFQFASLQGEYGSKLLKKHGLPLDLETFVLIENEKAYARSDAGIRLSKHLDGGWKLLYMFRIIPQQFRDCIYNEFAKRRYRWFGKEVVCKIPSPEIRQRFME